MGWKKSLTTILKKRTSRALSESDAIAGNHRDRNGSIEDDDDDDDDDDDEAESGHMGGTRAKTGTGGGASVSTPSPVRRRITNLARRRNRRNKQPNRTPPPYPRKPLVTTPPTDLRDASPSLGDEDNDEDDDGGYSGPRAYLQDGKTTVEGALSRGKRVSANSTRASHKITRTRSFESLQSAASSDDGLAHILKPYLGNQPEQSVTSGTHSTDENLDINAQMAKDNKKLPIKNGKLASSRSTVNKELSTLFEKEFEASDNSFSPRRPPHSVSKEEESAVKVVDTARQLLPVIKTAPLPDSREVEADRNGGQKSSSVTLRPSSSDRRAQVSKMEKKGPSGAPEVDKKELPQGTENVGKTLKKSQVAMSGFKEAQSAANEAAPRMLLEASSSPGRTEASNASTETDDVATHSSGHTPLLNNGKKKKSSFPAFVRPPKTAPSHLLRGRSRRRSDARGRSDSIAPPSPPGASEVNSSAKAEIGVATHLQPYDEKEENASIRRSPSPTSSRPVHEGVKNVDSGISHGSGKSAGASGSVATTSTISTPRARVFSPRSRSRWGKSPGEMLEKAEAATLMQAMSDEASASSQTLTETVATAPEGDPPKETDSPGELSFILTPTRKSSVSTVGQYYSDNDNFIIEDFNVEQQSGAYPPDDDEDSKFYADAREVLVSDDKSQVSARSAIVITEQKLKRVPNVDGTYTTDGGVGIEEDEFESPDRPAQRKSVGTTDRVIVVESHVNDNNVDYGRPDASYADLLEQEAGQEEVVKAAASAAIPPLASTGCEEEDDEDEDEDAKASGGGSAEADSAVSGSDVSSYLPATIDSSTMRNKMDTRRSSIDEETHAEIPKSVPRVPSRAVRTFKAAKAAAAAAVTPLVISRQESLKPKLEDNETNESASSEEKLSVPGVGGDTVEEDTNKFPHVKGDEDEAETASVGSAPNDESTKEQTVERTLRKNDVVAKDDTALSNDATVADIASSGPETPALAKGTTLSVEEYLSEVEEEGIETSPDLPPTYSVSASNGYAATVVPVPSTSESKASSPSIASNDGESDHEDHSPERKDDDKGNKTTTPPLPVSPSSSSLNFSSPVTGAGSKSVENRLEDIVSPKEMSSHLRLDEEDDEDDDDDESDDDVTEVTGYTDQTGYTDGSRLSEGDRSRISYILDHPAVAGRTSRRRRQDRKDEMSESSGVRKEEEDDDEDDDDDDETYYQSEDQESVSVRTMGEDSMDNTVGSASTMLSGHVSETGKRHAHKAAAIRQRGLAAKRRADSTEMYPRSDKPWSMSSIVQACYAGLSLPLFEEDDDEAKTVKRRVRRSRTNSDDDNRRSRTKREDDNDDDQTTEHRSLDSRRGRQRRDTSEDDSDDRYRVRRDEAAETDGDDSTMSRTVTTYEDGGDDSTAGDDDDTDGETTVSG